MSDQRGLYSKYSVQRNDGKEIPEGAFFMVFRLDRPKDEPARRALYVYAQLIQPENEALAGDIFEYLATFPDVHK